MKAGPGGHADVSTGQMLMLADADACKDYDGTRWDTEACVLQIAVRAAVDPISQVRQSVAAQHLPHLWHHLLCYCTSCAFCST
jgi:hypothetical protein